MPNPRHTKRKDKLMATFERYGIRPHTRRGQNFLLDKNQVNFIARAGEAGPDDIILEVGPGTGFLTTEMASTGALVLGIELDKKLHELLLGEMKEFPNFMVMRADILEDKTTINPEVFEKITELRELVGMDRKLKCISNLPYSAGTPFAANMFSSTLPWHSAVYMLQYEVAQRLVAKAGTEHYGNLSVVAHFGGKVKIERKVPPQVFWPRPRVDSAVISVKFHPLEQRMAVPWKKLRQVTVAIFNSRRKNLRNSLKGLFDKKLIDPMLEKLGLEGDSRGEQLSPEMMVKLANELD